MERSGAFILSWGAAPPSLVIAECSEPQSSHLWYRQIKLGTQFSGENAEVRKAWNSCPRPRKARAGLRTRKRVLYENIPKCELTD